jgi:hypothetical protein
MLGKIETPQMIELLDILLKMGYTEIRAIRKGKVKVYKKEFLVDLIKKLKKKLDNPKK